MTTGGLAEVLQPAVLQGEEGGAALEVHGQGDVVEVGVLATREQVEGRLAGGLAAGHEGGDAGPHPRRPHRCAGLEDVPKIDRFSPQAKRLKDEGKSKKNSPANLQVRSLGLGTRSLQAGQNTKRSCPCRGALWPRGGCSHSQADMA